MRTKKSQMEMLADDLIKGARVTAIDALRDYGCFRLSAIIYNLKNKVGLEIDSETITDDNTGKRFSSYYFTDDQMESNKIAGVKTARQLFDLHDYNYLE